MLGATYLGDGNAYTTGNIQSVTGRAGTFTAGLSLGYMYQQAPDNYVDYIGANAGTLIFASQDGNGRTVCYAGAGNTYRSIYSTFNFGALRNTTSTKQQLLVKYLEYLLPATVAEDKASDAIHHLVVGPNPSRGWIGIALMLTGPKRVDITVYDATGQKVRDLVFSGLNPGVNRLAWDGCNNQGQTVSAGTYVVRIQAGDDSVNRTVVLIK
jgi:hypothetical protein